MSYKNKTVNQPNDIVNAFAQYFQTGYTTSSTSNFNNVNSVTSYSCPTY